MVIFLMSALRAVSSSSLQGACMQAPVDTDQRACMSSVCPWAPKGLWEETDQMPEEAALAFLSSALPPGETSWLERTKA